MALKQWHETELANLKKWDQDRIESLTWQRISAEFFAESGELLFDDEISLLLVALSHPCPQRHRRRPSGIIGQLRR